MDIQLIIHLNINTTILRLREKREKKNTSRIISSTANWSSALGLKESIRIFTKIAINFAQFR